jgi:hypothetical protein
MLILTVLVAAQSVIAVTPTGVTTLLAQPALWPDEQASLLALGRAAQFPPVV